ncbi:DUF427 domain-containing protein [Streptomyces cavernicola]|uniref:DUF427 domain-containing protein n=1 Tax=Streptomyces cavernicola TaxID=3043613 RepID=A0ABT6SDG5_9ACTN|nr:DUF427 domain-containing protein [Streptomyces sp. B-S-A6]MDI3406232.1 DUF427 domain-containing protein [Streptomyces sp. B-S-A6]
MNQERPTEVDDSEFMDIARDPEHFTQSRARSLCFWKGLARYYSVTAGGQTDRNAAWYYPHPSPLARRIKHHVAFGNGVVVEEAAPQVKQ